MKRFPQDRIETVELKNKKFVHPIPLYICRPEKQALGKIFLFLCGLNGNNQASMYLNKPIFDQNYFVVFDRMGHGENKNKPSRFLFKYLCEINLVVQYLHDRFPGMKIYLIGESWGSALALEFYQRYPSTINGVFVWNMPSAIVDLYKITLGEKILIGMKMVFTVLTNITTYDKITPKKSQTQLLTNNELLQRIDRVYYKNRINNNKLSYVSWISLKKAWKILCKNCRNPNFNFVYLQTKQDVLYTDDKKTRYFFKNALKEHASFWPQGCHVLSHDKYLADQLFEQIQQWADKD